MATSGNDCRRTEWHKCGLNSLINVTLSCELFFHFQSSESRVKNVLNDIHLTEPIFPKGNMIKVASCFSHDVPSSTLDKGQKFKPEKIQSETEKNMMCVNKKK